MLNTLAIIRCLMDDDEESDFFFIKSTQPKMDETWENGYKAKDVHN